MTEFLHGIDTVRQKADSIITEADTSIVCIVGTAPVFNLKKENRTINIPQPIRGYDEIALYAGDDIEGFTLPDALKTVLDESEGATIYMINVFDPEKHTKTVTQTLPLLNKKVVINDLVISLNVKNYEEGKDFRVNKNTIEAISEEFQALESIDVEYIAADVTAVTKADYIGTTNEEGKRTGIQSIEDVQALYGDKVGIVIVPEASAIKEVRNAIELLADDLKFYAYYDAKKGMNVNKAVLSRTAPVDGFDSSTVTKNGTIVTPYVKRYSTYRDKTELRPLSPVAAGLRVYLDRNRNVAKSIDNTVSKTILGTEYPISFKLNKANTDANALNKAGYTTVINYKGAYRLWGGRNCAFPSTSGLETFEHVSRTANFIEDSIQDSSFEMVGETITQGFINDVLEAIKNFFNKLKNPQNQIILDGDVWYDPSSNSTEDLANGFIIFDYEFCPPPTVEHLRYRSKIKIQIITNTLGE